MPTVLHRTTKQLKLSANETEHPLVDWIWSPDLSAVTGFANRYWIITGDAVTLMSQAARDALDAQILSDARDTVRDQLDAVEALERAFALVLLDELNAHADKMNAILTAIDNGANLAGVKSNIAAIADYPQRTITNIKTAVRNKLGT